LNQMGSKRPPKLIFDASSLITAAQFNVRGQLIIEFITDWAQIVIPEGVKTEAVDLGLRAGYPDALELERLIRSRRIIVEKAPAADPAFETVMAAYEIEPGDVEILRLCRKTLDYDNVVVDDRLLYLILHRFNMHPIFLPDLIVAIVRDGAITNEIGEQMLNVIRPRYRSGFIEHSLMMLKGAI